MTERREDSRSNLILLLAALVFMFLRAPRPLVRGFLYAEEGTTFLRYAWDAPVIRALLAPHQSYFSIYPNVCGVIAARLIPLEYVGFFLGWSTIAVQLLMVLVVLQCEIFDSFMLKALAVMVSLLTVPTLTVGMSSIFAQFFLAICTGVILMSNAERLRIFRGSVLLLGGLTGVANCILTPFFLWAAWRDRSRTRAIQAGILVACTVIQVLVVLHMMQVQDRGLTRHSSLPFLLGTYLINGPLSQFFTPWSGHLMCHALLSPVLARWSSMLWIFAEMAAVAAFLFLAWLLVRGGTMARHFGQIAVFCLVTGLVGALPLNEKLMCVAGARYLFLCNVFVGLGLICALKTKQELIGATPRGLALLLGCILVSGISDDATLWTHPPYMWDWPTEVAHWRSDPTYELRIEPEYWPGVVLTREHANNPDLPAYIYDSNNIGSKLK
jgi:hypothetical protein